jgi:hypothetical protein
MRPLNAVTSSLVIDVPRSRRPESMRLAARDVPEQPRDRVLPLGARAELGVGEIDQHAVGQHAVQRFVAQQEELGGVHRFCLLV